MGRRARPKAPETSQAIEVQADAKSLAEAKNPEEILQIISKISKSVVSSSGKAVGTLDGENAIGEELRGVIPTGSIGLNMALGVGGWPRGRIIEVFGDESSGKTTLCLHAIAECQGAGGIAAFMDAEHALDRNYAKSLGIDTEQLLFHQPESGEDALQVVEKWIDTGEVDLIVVDSVAALTPKAELEGEIGDSHVGLQARLMGQAMRKLTHKLLAANAVLMFTNQTRMKIETGPYANRGGPKKTTTGGRALPFYASVRVEVTRIGALSQNDEKFGNRVKFHTIKNKVASPFRTAEVDILFGEGISMYGELIDYGAENSIVQKAGSWYSYGDTRLGQGKDNAIKFLANNIPVASEIGAKVMKVLSVNLKSQ